MDRGLLANSFLSLAIYESRHQRLFYDKIAKKRRFFSCYVG